MSKCTFIVIDSEHQESVQSFLQFVDYCFVFNKGTGIGEIVKDRYDNMNIEMTYDGFMQYMSFMSSRES